MASNGISNLKWPHWPQMTFLTSSDLIDLNYPQMALNGLKWPLMTFGTSNGLSDLKLAKLNFWTKMGVLPRCAKRRKATWLAGEYSTTKLLYYKKAFTNFSVVSPFFDFLKLLRYSISICMNKTPICIQKNSSHTLKYLQGETDCFENDSKCLILNFYHFGIFYQILTCLVTLFNRKLLIKSHFEFMDLGFLNNFCPIKHWPVW